MYNDVTGVDHDFSENGYAVVAAPPWIRLLRRLEPQILTLAVEVLNRRDLAAGCRAW
jgi:hypothetical protein